MKYQPEVDGLRAIAVSLVILFHSDLGISGGFVGVDVFFVISGYLITSLILRDIAHQKFSMIDFWERRVRRIFPALTATVLATIIATWLYYFPLDFRQCGAAVAAQSLFVSNLYHYRAANYFSPGADTMPLLHTWSLAVEEQFYILLPPLLVLLHRYASKLLPAILWGIAIGSFGLSVAYTPKFPEFSFYMLPTRAWELLLGSLIGVHASVLVRNRAVRETLAVGGLAAILVSAALYNPDTEFPGFAAAVPCLGAASFILAQRGGHTSAGNLLATSPFVFIGKISYSLYLVHWPILVISRYVLGEEPSLLLRMLMLVLMFVLAIASWAAVETPFRKKWVLPRSGPLFVFAATTIIAQFGFGALVYYRQGFPARFNDLTAKLSAPCVDRVSNRTQISLTDAMEGKFRPLGEAGAAPACLLWGDSHAMSLAMTIDAVCKQHHVGAFQATHSSTPPVLDLIHQSRFSLNADTPRYNQAVVDYILANKVRVVVIAGYWSSYADNPQFADNLARTINVLTRADVHVVLVHDVPLHDQSVPYTLARAAMLNQPVDRVGIPLAKHRERNASVTAAFAKLTSNNLTVVDPSTVLADETGLCRAELGHEAMYFDNQHLSCEGARKMVPLFEAALAPHLGVTADEPAAASPAPGTP